MTTRWVTDAGAGDGLGGNEANAMSYANFTDYMVTGGSFTAAPGDIFNIIGAITGRTTTSDAWVNGGNATSPVVVKGVVSGGATAYGGRTNGNGALITTNFPTISYTTGTLNITGNFIIIEALSITSANTSATGGTLKLGGTDVYVTRCAITNSSTNANAVAIIMNGNRDCVIDCDGFLTGATGGLTVIDVGANCKVIGNRIKGNAAGGSGIGLRFNSATNTVAVFNTVFNCQGIGISTTSITAAVCLLYNTVVGGGADGINIITGTTVSQLIVGNMITDNTGDGIDMVSTANAAFTANIRTRDNANAYANQGDWITSTNYNPVTTDTGGPETDYVASGSNDYRLIKASPAVDAGFPLYADIGSLQRIETAAGGGMRLAGHGGLAA